MKNIPIKWGMLIKKLSHLNESGFTLVDSLVSIALLGILGAALFFGMGTAMKTTGKMNTNRLAANLGQLQMEWVKQQSFFPAYTTVAEASSPVYAGYSVTTGVEPVGARDCNIQKITVTVECNGQIITLEGCKTR
jgi:type II secretory pathway pseudopilin PulG